MSFLRLWLQYRVKRNGVYRGMILLLVYRKFQEKMKPVFKNLSCHPLFFPALGGPQVFSQAITKTKDLSENVSIFGLNGSDSRSLLPLLLHDHGRSIVFAMI